MNTIHSPVSPDQRRAQAMTEWIAVRDRISLADATKIYRSLKPHDLIRLELEALGTNHPGGVQASYDPFER